MKNLRVGVLRGGPSSEYEISLQTGAAVLKHLPEGMTGVDIFIGRDGAWHIGGIPVKEGDALSGIDVVWNALHGAYGEDGTVQRTLELFGIPYTGSEPHPSFLGMQKDRAKNVLKGAGVRMAQQRIFRAREDVPEISARKIHGSFSPPWIIKPLAGGSSLGIRVARTFPELLTILSEMREDDTENAAYLVEELVRGKEATVGVIDGFRGEDTYALPPIEIRVPKESSFFDHVAKYSGKSEEICPGNFTRAEKEMLIDSARTVHCMLGLRHYSRSDFIVTPHGVYFLEVNTLPGLTEGSLFPKALDAIGSSLTHFIEHTLSHAMRRG